MNNKQIRRAMKNFVKHYGQQDTRKMTNLFSAAYKTPKQRIAGNLKTMHYDEKTILITTHIPACYSTMN
jgi:hypothetical protein